MFKHCLKCGAGLQNTLDDGFHRYTCHSCGWIYYNNPRPCVTAVIHQNQEILFIQRSVPPGIGKWDFPGGFMEIGEHPEQALQREINEEIGAIITHMQLLGFYPDTYDIEESIPILNMTYLCQIKNLNQTDSEEFDEMKWFSISELPTVFAFQSMQRILTDTISLLSKVS
ncbi:NUDIX domain-containing protein [bacterium]